MPGAACSATSRALFGQLFALGLDRGRFSIHEMLTDILEVVAVSAGLKPAMLAGHGERADWQLEGFERLAGSAGLHTRRSLPLPAEEANGLLASEFPRFAAARRELAAATAGHCPEVLWIWRDDGLESQLGRLLGGQREAFAPVLGYPDCCVAHEAQRDLQSVRALLRLFETQHGIGDEAGVLAALAAGFTVSGDPAASAALETVWRTRLVYPWLGYTACPDCLADPVASPSAVANAGLRRLAFALDRGFARAVWQAARSEAAVATRGDFRALDPQPGEACPCVSGLGFERCCAGIEPHLPAFR